MSTRTTKAQVDRFAATLPLGQENALRAEKLCKRLGITARSKKASEDDKRLVRAWKTKRGQRSRISKSTASRSRRSLADKVKWRFSYDIETST